LVSDLLQNNNSHRYYNMHAIDVRYDNIQSGMHNLSTCSIDTWDMVH